MCLFNLIEISIFFSFLSPRMVSFLAAFTFMCFENASLVTRTLVGVLWAAVAALILWCIFSTWESGTWDWLRCLCAGAILPKMKHRAIWWRRPSSLHLNLGHGSDDGLGYPSPPSRATDFTVLSGLQ
ncbi:hypothetical protein FB451DRAFT_56285 [Mycena latifolia]|nr:hypothetical protein FB451DRAFT_56285 [Mycena latifolia]